MFKLDKSLLGKQISYTIMGTLYQEPPLVQDLKVNVLDSTLIFSPHDHCEKKSMFISNIDQVLNFDVQTLHFFVANPKFPPKDVFQRIRNALEKLLLAYDFLGGRIKLNNETGRLEIDCNNAGLGFVMASSEFKLDDLVDLVYPNPSFEQLVTKTMKNETKMEDQPLCIVQVTEFKCGGFVMGLQTNHAIFDGISAHHFLQNLAALAGDKPLAIVPCNDRELLAARDPPRVTFPHPELLRLDALPIATNGHGGGGGGGDEGEQNPTIFDATLENLDFKIFSLCGNDIINLKAKAKEGPTNGKGKITSFNVVSALVWRCKALSSSDEDKERLSTMLYTVDIRPRLIPALPASYTGNAVLTAYARTTCRELEEAPLSKLVDLVTEGVLRMTDEYAKSVIDWGQLYKGFPNGEFLISSWWKLGFNQVEYPWGKPKYSCPLVYHRKDIILFFPDIDETNGGVNVLVALPHKEMIKFQALFEKFSSI